jgi:hypothetical protein
MTTRKLLPGFLFLCSLCTAPALDHYRVDFNPPLHTAGQLPAVQVGSAGPSQIVTGFPTVMSSFGHLTDQPLVFNGVHYEQIAFDLGRHQPNYFIEFDFETHNLNPSLFAFTVHLDAPLINPVTLHGLGEIQVQNLPPQAGWTDNELHHIRIEADLETLTMRVLLDNRPPMVTPFTSGNGDVASIRFNLSAWFFEAPDDPTVQVGIDNLVIGSVVPEARIISPPTGTRVLTGSILPLIAEASSPKGAVQDVQFFANGRRAGFGTNVPGTIHYRLDWVPPTPGDYAIHAVGRDTAGNVFASPEIQVGADPLISVSRSLPQNYRPGHKTVVTLSAVPIVPLANYAVDDQLPAGWTAEHISDGGVFDPVTGSVRFGPFPDDAERVLRYQARAPAGSSGVQRFDGTAYADWFAHPITGADAIFPFASPRP